MTTERPAFRLLHSLSLSLPYLVLALTNPRVNQRRHADPHHSSRLKFPALAQRLSQNASLQHEK